MIDNLLLTATRVATFLGSFPLTNASGFFFRREGRLFLVTSRHVVKDLPSHNPDRIEIDIHTSPNNMAEAVAFSIPLYQNGLSVWRQGRDGAGEVDVAVIELDQSALPPNAVYSAFTPEHIPKAWDAVEIGAQLLLPGFPLGFHDSLHHLPVVRQGLLASSFGLRFQGEGYFLTDARTHSGSSGAPVVMKVDQQQHELAGLTWLLLGVHSARLDMGLRNHQIDEALGLNCAWYADILLTLTT